MVTRFDRLWIEDWWGSSNLSRKNATTGMHLCLKWLWVVGNRSVSMSLKEKSNRGQTRMKRRGREESERRKNALEFIFIFSVNLIILKRGCVILGFTWLSWPTKKVFPFPFQANYSTEVKNKMEVNGDANQSPSIDKLPNEILVKIFKLLQYREILMSYRTCKRWRQLTSGFFEKLTTKSK